jgi:nucleotide-binding universal stress UspA family protein
MILLSYDGSVDAHAAISHAAQLMPGAEATVLTVWEPFVDALTRNGSLGMGMGLDGSCGDTEAMDAASQETALARATEGASRAAAAGLDAQARTESRMGDVADAILTTAGVLDAELIVVGTRGLSGVRSPLLGSVSHAVMQRADRAVMVVPSPALGRDSDMMAHLHAIQLHRTMGEQVPVPAGASHL